MFLREGMNMSHEVYDGVPLNTSTTAQTLTDSLGFQARKQAGNLSFNGELVFVFIDVDLMFFVLSFDYFNFF